MPTITLSFISLHCLLVGKMLHLVLASAAVMSDMQMIIPTQGRTEPQAQRLCNKLVSIEDRLLRISHRLKLAKRLSHQL